MVAVTGPLLSRRAELLALWCTAAAALATAVVPALYVLTLPAACAATAAAAPRGRRLAAALVVWLSVSLAAVSSGAA